MVVFKALLVAVLVSQANDQSHITGSGLFGRPLQKGDEVKVLGLYPGDKTLCCAGPESYRRYLKAVQARDDVGMAAIVEEGQAVLLDEGTEVKILDEHQQQYETYRGASPLDGQPAIISRAVGEPIPVMAYEVRVLSGPNKGKAGWLPEDRHAKELLLGYRAASSVFIGIPDRKTGRFNPEGKVQVASDVEAYNDYWLKYKIYGNVFESGSLTKARRVIDIAEGTPANVIAFHGRKAGVLTEPAVQVKFLAGPQKGRTGYLHPAQITASGKSRRR